MIEKPLVSIIIPTRNSELTIGDCLESIKKQTYPNIEIIVVDNYSMDKTREISEQYEARVFVAAPERSTQRNRGASSSMGEYLLFVDSDMELEPKLVGEGTELLRVQYESLIVPEVTVGNTYWARVRAYERSLYVGSKTFQAARYMRRDIFVALGGYDEDLTGPEDYDLQVRLERAGCRIGYTRSRIIHHEEGFNIKGHLRKKAYYAKSLKKYALKHPERADKQLGLIRVAVYVEAVLNNPFLGFGLITLKGLEYLITKVVIAQSQPV